jgi:hypothetical protein
MNLKRCKVRDNRDEQNDDGPKEEASVLILHFEAR